MKIPRKREEESSAISWRQRAENLVLRESVQVLNEQVCNLKTEMACAEFVTHELMRKNRDLRQAMILQGEMLRQKDFVASQLTHIATENYELKLQNAKLWAVVEKQKKALIAA